MFVRHNLWVALFDAGILWDCLCLTGECHSLALSARSALGCPGLCSKFSDACSCRFTGRSGILISSKIPIDSGWRSRKACLRGMAMQDTRLQKGRWIIESNRCEHGSPSNNNSFTCRRMGLNTVPLATENISHMDKYQHGRVRLESTHCW